VPRAPWRDCNIYNTFSDSNYLKVWGLAEAGKDLEFAGGMARKILFNQEGDKTC